MAIALTLSELARWIDGDIVRGGLDLSFTGMAALDEAGPGDVSFLGNEKYHTQFEQTKAGAVIVPRGETGGPADTALIAVDNPTLAFSTVVRHFAAASRAFAPGVSPTAFVDPSATLDPQKVRVHPGAVIMAGARVGDGTELGPNSVVGEGAVIGRDCHLMANTTVRERCVLGDRVILQPGAVIGSDGYGYQLVDGRHVKIDQVGIVEIHDDVEIGANTTIDRARFGKTVIGQGTKIDNLVQIGHNARIGQHCLICGQAGVAGSAVIEDRAVLGGRSAIGDHLRIGRNAIVMGNAGVATHVPDNAVMFGYPAVRYDQHLAMFKALRRLPRFMARFEAEKTVPKAGETD